MQTWLGEDWVRGRPDEPKGSPEDCENKQLVCACGCKGTGLQKHYAAGAVGVKCWSRKMAVPSRRLPITMLRSALNVVCGSAFVAMSASCMVVSTLSGRMNPSRRHCWTQKKRVAMCLDADHFALALDHCRAELESTFKGVGCKMARPMDACNRRMKRASRAASDAATISASAELRAMERWRDEAHITAAPCSMVMRPLVLWRVSMHPAQSLSENVWTGWVRSVW